MEGGWGELESVIFFHTESKYKKDIFFGGAGLGWGGGGGAGGDGWLDRRTSPDQFAPSISSKLGA